MILLLFLPAKLTCIHRIWTRHDRWGVGVWGNWIPKIVKICHIFVRFNPYLKICELTQHWKFVNLPNICWRNPFEKKHLKKCTALLAICFALIKKNLLTNPSWNDFYFLEIIFFEFWDPPTKKIKISNWELR